MLCKDVQKAEYKKEREIRLQKAREGEREREGSNLSLRGEEGWFRAVEQEIAASSVT